MPVHRQHAAAGRRRAGAERGPRAPAGAVVRAEDRRRGLAAAAQRSTTQHAQVPREIVARLRSLCLDLPEAYEETAWVGTRWSVRKKNFAHVLVIDAGWPPAYAKAANASGPICVLTFRSSGPALDTPRFGRPPFFRPGWWPNIVGMVLDARTDWDDVAARLTTSYCALAPKKLADLVDYVPD